MKVVLCRSPQLGSHALRFLMLSRWSHTAIYDDEAGVVYDTTLTGNGCKVHTKEDFFAHYPDFAIRHVNVKDVTAARKWLADQVGKPYDWRALFGFGFRTSWQDESAWFCSEHAAAFVNQFDADGPWFTGGTWRITPNHFQVVHRGIK